MKSLAAKSWHTNRVIRSHMMHIRLILYASSVSARVSMRASGESFRGPRVANSRNDLQLPFETTLTLLSGFYIHPFLLMSDSDSDRS